MAQFPGKTVARYERTSSGASVPPLWRSGSPPGREQHPLRLLHSAYAFNHIEGHRARWAAWDAFCDHHGVSADRPDDHHLVAFVEARALAGLSFSSLTSTLTTLRLGIEGTPRLADASRLTVPATRHLANRLTDGWFNPTSQAPVLTVGQLHALVEATRQLPTSPLRRARARLLVVLGYLGALRPGELTHPDLEHLETDGTCLRLLLPHTKTGQWQRLELTAATDLLDPAAAACDYLAHRGDRDGPLVIDDDGERVSSQSITNTLRSTAAQAGITAFSPYSLRRSWATHAHLAGHDSRFIRARLRHKPTSQTYRRYIEPLLAVMDHQHARTHYLNPTAASQPPVAVDEVGAGRQHAPALAFAAGTLDELLDNLDLPALRVPKQLAHHEQATIEAGKRAFRRWAQWAREHDEAPTSPSSSALARWTSQQLAAGTVSNAATQLASVQLGWAAATGSDEEMPGAAHARWLVRGAARERGETTGKKSPPATDDDVRAALPQVPHLGDASSPVPGERWARRVLAAVSATESLTVAALERDRVLLASHDGRQRWVRRADSQMLCPVAAAETLGVGVQVKGHATTAEVIAAATPRTRVLRDRMLLAVMAGSGGRPKDIAGARLDGLGEAPSGAFIKLIAAKGQRRDRTGRHRLLWLPARDDELDGYTAIGEWLAWWPYRHGPLVPRLTSSADIAAGTLTACSPAYISTRVAQLFADAGRPELSAYGLRYGAAQRAHDAGTSDEAIAELLGHAGPQTVRGYIQFIDPFAGGHDQDLLEVLADG